MGLCSCTGLQRDNLIFQLQATVFEVNMTIVLTKSPLLFFYLTISCWSIVVLIMISLKSYFLNWFNSWIQFTIFVFWLFWGFLGGTSHMPHLPSLTIIISMYLLTYDCFLNDFVTVNSIIANALCSSLCFHLKWNVLLKIEQANLSRLFSLLSFCFLASYSDCALWGERSQ